MPQIETVIGDSGKLDEPRQSLSIQHARLPGGLIKSELLYISYQPSNAEFKLPDGSAFEQLRGEVQSEHSQTLSDTDWEWDQIHGNSQSQTITQLQPSQSQTLTQSEPSQSQTTSGCEQIYGSAWNSEREESAFIKDVHHILAKCGYGRN